jgi:PKD repeat protein
MTVRQMSVRFVYILVLFLCITAVSVQASDVSGNLSSFSPENSSQAAADADSVSLLRADFTLAPVHGPVPLAVSFQDISQGHPDRWFWDFGNGITSAVQHPNVTYADVGLYNVTLSVWSENETDSVSESGCVRVEGLSDENFSADFMMDPATGEAPLTVHFYDASTGGADTWFWDFGDGYTAMRKNPVHTYMFPGIYDVYLTAWSDNYTVISWTREIGESACWMTSVTIT